MRGRVNSIQSPYCWCVGGISGLTQLSIRQTGEGLTSEGINTQVIKLKEQGCVIRRVVWSRELVLGSRGVERGKVGKPLMPFPIS